MNGYLCSCGGRLVRFGKTEVSIEDRVFIVHLHCEVCGKRYLLVIDEQARRALKPAQLVKQ